MIQYLLTSTPSREHNLCSYQSGCPGYRPRPHVTAIVRCGRMVLWIMAMELELEAHTRVRHYSTVAHTDAGQKVVLHRHHTLHTRTLYCLYHCQSPKATSRWTAMLRYGNHDARQLQNKERFHPKKKRERSEAILSINFFRRVIAPCLFLLAITRHIN